MSSSARWFEDVFEGLLSSSEWPIHSRAEGVQRPSAVDDGADCLETFRVVAPIEVAQPTRKLVRLPANVASRDNRQQPEGLVNLFEVLRE